MAAARRSTTAANKALITAATGLSAWTATAPKITVKLQRREVAMAPEELSIAEYPLELLQTHAEMSLQCDDTTNVTAHINFLVDS